MNHVSPLLFASLLALATVSTRAALPIPETLPSGVIVQTLTKGTGPSPRASDTIKVHYRGTLTNGIKFDNSHKRGQSISFPLSRAIPCQTEGVQKIQMGDKAKLTCPAASAYGERGIPGTIPPNSTLNFEVELLGIGGWPKGRQIGLTITFS